MGPGPLHDDDRFWALVSGNAALAKHVIATFVRDLPRLTQSLHQAIDKNDVPAFRFGIHKLKGALAAVCAEEALPTLKAIEEERGPDLRPIADRSRGLDAEVERLRGEVTQLYLAAEAPPQ